MIYDMVQKDVSKVSPNLPFLHIYSSFPDNRKYVPLNVSTDEYYINALKIYRHDRRDPHTSRITDKDIVSIKIIAL